LKKKDLRATVSTYQTWELRELAMLYRIGDEAKKLEIVDGELKRRRNKSYNPKTLNPKVKLDRRLALIS
jgi:hypothetical protein